MVMKNPIKKEKMYFANNFASVYHNKLNFGPLSLKGKVILNLFM